MVQQAAQTPETGSKPTKQPVVSATPKIGVAFTVEGELPSSVEDVDQEFIQGHEADPIWQEVNWQMAEYSPAYFAAKMLRGPTQEPYNGKFKLAPHHGKWDELVTTHKRVCVLAPRDHGKSYFFTFAYPLWRAVMRPGETGFLFSATKEQAVLILQKIKDELENNPHLQHLVPVAANRKWSETHIRLANGSEILARGMGTKVRGAHPHYVVVDDGLNDDALYSEHARSKVINYFKSAITNMVVPGGSILVVGTPFHSNDLYGNLAHNKQYHHSRYPAMNDDGEALWPERYNRDLLAAKEEEIGSIAFAREFLCVPVADTNSFFPTSLFNGNPDVMRPDLRLGMSLEEFEEAAGEKLQVSMGVDLAISTTIGADYTVVWTMGVDSKKNRWILDIRREKGMPFRKQLALIETVANYYEPSVIYLEANQMQRVFHDELKTTTDLPVHAFTTTAARNTLDKGVPSLRPLFENAKYRVPRGDEFSREMTDIWFDELRSFTMVNGKIQSVGGHDDTVMADWICEQAIRGAHFSFSFGPEDQTNEPEAPVTPRSTKPTKHRGVGALLESIYGPTVTSGTQTEADESSEGSLIDEDFAPSRLFGV